MVRDLGKENRFHSGRTHEIGNTMNLQVFENLSNANDRVTLFTPPT